MKNLLLTTNCSDVSRKAYGAAASLAGHYCSNIHLVHEAQLMLAFHWGGKLRLRHLHHDLQQHLRHELSHPAFQKVPVKAHDLSEKKTCESLTDFAIGEHIDLTITPAPEESSPRLLDGFTEELIGHSPTPVLVYRRKSGKLFPRYVLVPHGFSDITTSAVLPTIRFLQTHYKSNFIFLNVLSSLTGGFADSYFATISDVVQKTTELPPGTRASFDIREGDPHREIIKEAEKANVDLIVMVSNCSAAAVARNVVYNAPCSVMTVRSA